MTHRPAPAGPLVSATLALAIALSIPEAVAQSTFEPRRFDSPAQEQSYRTLIDELRCLVCQNQNLADSNADLASDLRDEIHRMLRDGRSEAEIVDFMVDRYGEFVLYRPPMRPATIALWIGPFVLAILALVVLVRRVRAPSRQAGDVTLDPQARRRAAALLEGDEPPA